jgi:hypothetical protein
MGPLYLMALAAGAIAAVTFLVNQRSAAVGVQPAVVIVSWLACAGATAWAARRDQSGTLKWLAGTWTWEGRDGACKGSVVVMVDLQRTMIVIFSSEDGRKFWHCLHRRADPAAWLALRRAVVSSSGLGSRSTGQVDRDTPL